MATMRRSIVIALAGLTLAACGDGGGHGSTTRIPSADELAGTYDLTTTFEGSSQPVRGVASAVGGASGDFELTFSAPSAEARGTLQADGTTALDGMTLGSDAIEFVHGQARAEVRAGVLRISGTLDAGIQGRVVFTMERPLDADLSGMSGRYRVTFARSQSSCGCATAADLELTVAADGTGTAADASEIDSAGVAVGVLTRVSLRVSPSGRFVLSAGYRNPPLGSCTAALAALGHDVTHLEDTGQPAAPRPAPSVDEGCVFLLHGTLPARIGASTSASFVLEDIRTFPTFGSGEVTIARR